MTEFFTEKDFNEIASQRKKLLLIYALIAVLYLLFSAGFIAWGMLLPLDSPKDSLVVWLHHFLSAVFVTVTVIFFGIPFKRVHRVYRLYTNYKTGLKKNAEGVFLRYEEELVDRYGVDSKCIVFEEIDKHHGTTFENRVFIPCEKEFPKFNEGDKVKYVLHAGFLLKYQIVNEKE